MLPVAQIDDASYGYRLFEENTFTVKSCYVDARRKETNAASANSVGSTVGSAKTHRLEIN